ncbi:ATP-binding protein [Brevibacillus brevis]|uniref:ATP-binding protein n=1 Tax=Brevibacillus brevis TaxID=1393 RepID=UPI0037CC1321
MSLITAIKKLASVDIFTQARQADKFVGRPFSLDYDKALLLVADSWKFNVGGIPQGSFLLAFYENEELVSEALLLRVIKPTKLPTDNDVISSMIEYYKDNMKTSGKESKLDDYTRYEFSFSGVECRILGTFYKDNDDKTIFGADVENFYSAHNYSVYKPTEDVLEFIANLRDGDKIPGSECDIKIGKVRYSSSSRFQQNSVDVPVYVNSQDFLGKRTAMFGMTRTGKSNTVKKVIQSVEELSQKATFDIAKFKSSTEANLEPCDERGIPKFPVGQIIFDINGEYANANMQDEGTAIFELYKSKVVRYSVLEKDGFNIMKVNFYADIESGFGLITNHFRQINEKADYVSSFLSISLEKPDDYDQDYSVKNRYDRKLAAYLCCLYKAGFPLPNDIKIKFQGKKDLNDLVRKNPIVPDKGISPEEATIWFTQVWENYKKWDYLKEYASQKGHEWADEELKALLGFLTRHKEPGSSSLVSGYLKLKPLIKLHSEKSDKSFEEKIAGELRQGKIVIIDLSQGDPEIQRLYSERICHKIFSVSMNNFINNTPNNFIQFYFEEAHNLFPKKDDKDLSQIYNRIAKEGAKLHLGLTYATQEVSSISSNILKNTQNWFIAHLNNDDELKEIKKYYDFADFTDGLVRFSAGSDKGFVRIKTYSNPFIVPVQIDRFSAKKVN